MLQEIRARSYYFASDIQLSQIGDEIERLRKTRDIRIINVIYDNLKNSEYTRVIAIVEIQDMNMKEQL